MGIKRFLLSILLGLFVCSMASAQKLQNFTSGSSIYSGQIVSLANTNQVVPIAAGSLSGVYGVATNGANSAGIPVVVQTSETVTVAVDNACAIGNFVEVSPAIFAGNGHCVSSSPTTQVIGVALAASSASSSIPVQMSALTASSGGASSSGTFAGPVTAGSDGVHPGYFSCNGNTTAPPVSASLFELICPNSVTFTGYGVQVPTSSPSNATPVFSCATPVLGVSSCSWTAAGAPGTYFSTNGYGGGNQPVGTANHTICGSIIVPPGGLSVGHIGVTIATADGAHNEDIGIYGASGALEAHIGASALGSTGSQSIAFTGGTQTIAAGKNYVCWTSVGTTFSIDVDQNQQVIYGVQDVGLTTSGGVLPGTFTPPADSPQAAGFNGPAIVLLP